VIALFQHIHSFFSALWERWNPHTNISQPIAPHTNTLIAEDAHRKNRVMQRYADLAADFTTAPFLPTSRGA